MTQQVTVKQGEPLPVIQSESAQLIDLIGRLASDPNSDIDKMERLMAMRERVLDREAKQAFNAAFSAAKSEMPQVVRNAKNDQTNSMYATEDAIDLAITPIITKHGFAMSFSSGSSPREGHEHIICILSHENGYERTYEAQIPVAGVGLKGIRNMTHTHAYGSTKTYARRYMKFDIWDIATTDDDGQAAGRDPVVQAYKDRIQKASAGKEMAAIRSDIMNDNALSDVGRKEAGKAWNARNLYLETDNG